MRVAKLMYHPYEEDMVSGVSKGYKGTFAIFFYGCNMHCVYCQNSKISRTKITDKIPDDRLFSKESLSDKMIEAEKNGAYTISFITGVFYIDEIIETIKLAKEKGLTIPIVYNSSGYENADHIKKLDGLIDIYLPDFRYADDSLAKIYSEVGHYVDTAKACIAEMRRQTQDVIVRVLILPSHTKDAIARIKYLYDTYGDDIYISIMSQYTPIIENEGISAFPELTRRLTKREYEKVVENAINMGLKKAFIQDMESASSIFIPDFS